MKRIHILEDPTIEKRVPEQCLAEIEIITNQGKEYNSGIMAAKGDWDRPLSGQDLENKFINITNGVLSEKETNSLIAIVKDFENYNVEDLIKFLT